MSGHIRPIVTELHESGFEIIHNAKPQWDRRARLAGREEDWPAVRRKGVPRWPSSAGMDRAATSQRAGWRATGWSRTRTRDRCPARPMPTGLLAAAPNLVTHVDWRRAQAGRQIHWSVAPPDRRRRRRYRRPRYQAQRKIGRA